MIRPRRRLALLGCLAALSAGTGPAHATDLGEGNRSVKERFEAWRKAGPRTRGPAAPAAGAPDAKDPPRRVLVTGFGLFSGVEFNVSGVVVESLADPGFWPERWSAATSRGPPEGARPGAGRLTAADGGARVWQRALTIEGRRHEVAFLLLDVLWDLSAAIAIYEAGNFRPDLVLMTGLGGPEVVLEGGALNRAIPHPGFAPDGAPVPANLPRAAHLLDPDLEGVEADIAATWDNRRLAEAIRPLVRRIDPAVPVLAPAGGRPENAYICNHLTHLMLHAAKGLEVPLAGGEVRLRARLSGAQVGFLHYPQSARRTPEEVWRWAEVIARIVHEAR